MAGSGVMRLRNAKKQAARKGMSSNKGGVAFQGTGDVTNAPLSGKKGPQKNLGALGMIKGGEMTMNPHTPPGRRKVSGKKMAMY